jgi:pimeloyl-ACP methyl ester carboxylesterase
LIVYAHGYVAPNRPVGIPEDQMLLPGTNTSVADTVTGLNYAFAASSYRVNGLAVQQAIADLMDVVAVFKAKKGEPQQVLLIGVSEGGLITTLAIEQHPDVFSGGLAMCGPYGSFVDQTNYFGDFRVLFDYFFPNLLPATPVDVPPSLLDTWETTTYSTTIRPVISDTANAGKVDQLLAVAEAPYDTKDATSKVKSIAAILWYNIFATNDAKAKLSGQPFGNATRVYTTDDAQLNPTVARFNADAVALQAIAAGYETSGQLSVPLVTLHTTGDPVVPYRQADQYQAKVNAANRAALYAHFKVEAYGHCQFSSLDIFTAFNKLTALVDNPPPFPRIYLPFVSRN